MPYYFDTVVLSNFALAGRMDLLQARYGCELHITPEVRDELADGVVAGYTALAALEELLITGVFTVAPPLVSAAERGAYLGLLRTLGAGETSCLVCAECRGGIVATDDRAARGHCAARGITVTGTIGILVAVCRDGLLSPPAADTVLTDMVAAGFYSPVPHISELL